MRFFSGQLNANKSLTQILTTAFLLLSLTILCISSLLQFFVYFQSETNVLYSKQKLIAEGVKNTVSGFIKEKIRSLEAVAGLNNPDTTTPEEWQLILQRLLGLEKTLRTLALVNIQNEIIVHVSRFSPSRIDMYPNGLSVRYPHPQNQTSSISEIYIDGKTSEPIVSIRVPVKDALKETKGSLIAELNLKFIWDLVDRLKVGHTGYAYVVDQNGDLIAFGDTARVLKGENVSHLPPVAKFLKKSDNPEMSGSSFYKGLTGGYVVGTYVPLKTASWVIVAEMPWKEAYWEVIRMGIISLAIIAVMTFLAAKLGAGIARRLTVPLANLKETAGRIAQGEKALQAKVTGPAEVVHLANAFNSMSSQLVGSLRETELQIEQLRLAKNALQESEKRLRLALEGTTDGIWDWNIDTDQTYLSPRWYAILGYEPNEFEVSLDRWRKLIHPEDLEKTERFFKHGIMSHKPFAIEFRMMANNGQWRWIQSRGKVVETAPDNRAIRVAGSMTDISRRKKAEKERAELEAKYLQAQKMESVGRLAGGVAHDFNNMLGVILGHTELALLKVSPGNSIIDDLQEIRIAAERSADLTRQLLAFARRQTISPKVLNINKTVEGMLKMLQRLMGENIELVWLAGKNIWSVKVDPMQIDQVLANLCVNARDAIIDTGKVFIETKNAVFEEAFGPANEEVLPGDFVMLSVGDDGCGMDKKIREKLFEPFFTTKEAGKGTGLGLATVYGIVRQNGGFINVYSEPGKGTTFKIYFPRYTGNIAENDAQREIQIRHGQGERVLIVEDDASILNMGKMMLEGLGYQVLTAQTTADAIRLVENENTAVQLLLTDVIMPEMNGWDLACRLRKLYPEMKCLFMSGYTADVIAHHGVLEKGVIFIEKPFSMKSLAAKVSEALDNPSEKVC